MQGYSLYTLNQPSKNILVAPLNWGLGHATRLFPVIQTIISQGHHVLIASAPRFKPLFFVSFPTCTYIEIDEPQILFRDSHPFKLLHHLKLSNQIRKSIRTEQAWIKNVISDFSIDLIISDNRYGLYHCEVPSVFITHQLSPITGYGYIADRLIQLYLYKYMNRFTECWVPDVSTADNLAGKLSQTPHNPKVPVHYIGWLSRLSPLATTHKENYLLVLLSGPEPARTDFENLLLQQISTLNQKCVFIRGVTYNTLELKNTEQTTFYNQADSHLLSQLIQDAAWMVSRSGYSSIMDIIRFNKHSVLVPTPGQTEQEYLAAYLSKKGIAPFVPQSKFNLLDCSKKQAAFEYRLPTFTFNEDLLIKRIEKLLFKEARP